MNTLQILCSETGLSFINPQQRFTQRDNQGKSNMPKEEDANLPRINLRLSEAQILSKDMARLVVHT